MVHKNVDFNNAEKEVVVHKLEDDIDLKMIPYAFLKKVKLLSRRDKHLSDIARLDELNLKNKKK